MESIKTCHSGQHHDSCAATARTRRIHTLMCRLLITHADKSARACRSARVDTALCCNNTNVSNA